MRLTIFISLAVIFLTACSHTTKIQTLKPAQITRAAKIKTIAVYRFKNDNINLSSKIESSLAAKKVNNKNYFTMISHSDIDKVFQEQRLQDSGLLDESSSVEVGNLLGAQALISGIVSSAEAVNNYYKVKRTKCIDKKCKETRVYYVNCVERTFNIAAQIKMVDIEKGDIIYSDNIKETSSSSKCNDRSNTLVSKAYGLELLSSKIASKFAKLLTPNQIEINVVLLDEADIKYTDKQEQMLENAIKYIDYKRYEKSKRILSKLLESTNDKSYVAAYNLGVVQEIDGDLTKAKQLYLLADDLSQEPIEEINLAITRINKSIGDEIILKEQMKR